MTFLKRSASSLLLAHQLAKVGAVAVTDHHELTVSGTDCHNQICHPIEQYCSHFEQTCLPCAAVCNPKDLKYEPSVCSRDCSDFIKLQPLKNEIHHIQMQQNIILILLVLLLIITGLHYTWKFIKWLKNKRCIPQLLKKLKLRKETPTSATHSNGKDLGGTTIQNICVIQDLERASSQIYSTGAEGSVMTMTTPISSRHPAENTTPSPQPNEYSYDNQALAVTPVSDKPSDFIKLQPLKNEIHHIQMQQNIILILLVLLLIITGLHYTWKFIKWLKNKRCIPQLLKKLKLRKETPTSATHSNGKDLGGTTIQNICVIQDLERASSQIYSTGAEGSVMTMTTPISSRHPAENTTPSPQPNEYSYDNQALAVTPVSDKPSGTAMF